jgi:transcriptional regulatory protein RtcR
MSVARRTVLGILGLSLDAGLDVDRWNNWRPSVSLCQHEDFLIDRFVLLYEPKSERLFQQVADDIRAVSPETEVVGQEIPFDDPWDFEGVYAALHDFATSYPFKVEEHEYLVHITTGSHVAQICLFLLTESRYLPGKLLQSAPPARRNTHAAGEYRIIDLDLSRYDRLASRFAQEQHAGASFLKSGIATRNEAFNRLIDQIERVAGHSKAPMLLTGPTGAGKSRLAKRIFELKKQRRQLEGAFVEVNCATLRGDGAMSAIFGHVKGSFTGATHDRPGLLRAADRGLLFLDEIGELGLDEQAMLLRALEEKRFLPVGSDKEAVADFQLIAGTNRDLPAAVRAGRFRDDLLARINLWSFQLPALRERPEDIDPNLRYELEQYARASGTKVAFNKEACERFLRFAMAGDAAWAGNFRDLNAAVTRMATFAAGGRITEAIVDEEVARLRSAWRGDDRPTLEIDLAAILPSDELAQIDPFDMVQLAEVVRVCRTSRSLSEAGRKLFAVSRQAKAVPNDADRLRKYLARFKIDWQALQA